MITVKFLGGAKKSFDTDYVSLDLKDITINELLLLLQKEKPKNTMDLDINNILIAVNGVDSSALDGNNTKLRSGDDISIIPVIHGGSNFHTFHKTTVMVCPISADKNSDHMFLDSLRCKYPKLTIQVITARFILNMHHIRKILLVSLESKKRQVMLSDKLEIDILLRFACTTQISKAISDLGIKPNKDFVIIALGNKISLEKLYRDVSDYVDPTILDKSNESHIKKYFKISHKQLNVISSKTPLEDIMQEQSSILF